MKITPGSLVRVQNGVWCWFHQDPLWPSEHDVALSSNHLIFVLSTGVSIPECGPLSLVILNGMLGWVDNTKIELIE